VDSYWSTGRMEAFSDGVFAIAITLLILEVSVPESEFDHLWRGIAHQWPAYLAYATSFLTIGGIWMAHHGIFRRLEFANQRLMVLNLLLLMTTAFLPFPTKLMAEAVHDQDAARTAVVFYGASLLVISLLLNSLWGSAALDRHVLRQDVSDDEIKAIALATTPNIGLYVGMIVLALFAPRAAIVGFLVIAVVSVLRSPGDNMRIRQARLVAR
jgi:uncharacterized membrane protein